MADKQGLFSFPGLRSILKGDFTLSHGISPSAATIVISPQSNFAVSTGPLVISYGTRQIRFEDCFLDLTTMQVGADGTTLTLRIVDRRRKWKFGYVSGSYNQFRSDGRLNKATEKTPQQLAAILLTEMGETNFDVSGLPNETRPKVDWDYSNPAEALAQLCDTLGCRVVLTTKDKVKICQLGVGADLPTDRFSAGGYSFDPPDVPDKLLFVCGPTRYQVRFNLEAVGRDISGEVVPIAELSYNPRGKGETYGWVDQYPDKFQSLIGTDQGQEKVRALALETVFRWYRIKEPATKDMEIPKYGRIEKISQILPLDDRLIDQETAIDETYPQPQHAIISGRFMDDVGDPKPLVPTAMGTRCKFGYSLDKERGIVMFSQPLFLQTRLSQDLYTNDGLTKILSANSLANIPAFLTIECVVTVKDAKTRKPERHTVERDLGNGRFRTKPKVIRRDDIFLTRRVRYTDLAETTYGMDDLLSFTDATGGIPVQSVTQIIENRVAGPGVHGDQGIDNRIKYYLDSEVARITPKESLNYSYVEIRDISPDGAIHQVSWSVGPDGATTTASKNSEFDLVVPSYDERRMVELARIERERLQSFREERETT